MVEVERAVNECAEDRLLGLGRLDLVDGLVLVLEWALVVGVEPGVGELHRSSLEKISREEYAKGSFRFFILPFLWHFYNAKVPQSL